MKTGTLGKGVLEDILLLNKVISGDMSISSYNEAGEKLATINVDGSDIDIFSPAIQVDNLYNQMNGVRACTIKYGDKSYGVNVPRGINSVTIDSNMTSGVEIATINVDGGEASIYAPSAYFVPVLTSGIKVGTFVFNGTSTDVFAPVPGSTVGIQQFLSPGGQDNPTSTFVTVNDQTTLISSDDVSITADYLSGLHLATVRINNEDYEIYCPSCSCPCPLPY